MRCVVCKNGKTKVGKATVTLDKGAATLSSKAFRRVSAPTAVRNMSMEKLPQACLNPPPRPPALEFRSKFASSLRLDG